MKERKVCSRAGSDTLLRKRSRYAVVVITSSRVSFTEPGRREHGVKTSNYFLVFLHCILYTPNEVLHGGEEEEEEEVPTLWRAGARTGTRNPL